MKTTTVYTETLTITTEDNGARTIERSSHAQTLREYYFTELTPEAQQRAIDDAIEEETDPANWYGSQTCITEDEIWDAAHELEKQQPIRFYTDPGGSACAEARAGRFIYDPFELVTMAENTGICFSMDICDKWNEYAPRIMALVEGRDEAIERRDIHEANADTANDNSEYETGEKEWQRACKYDAIADKCVQVAEALTDEAAQACGDVLDGLIEAERDYYQSADFWREWLADSDDRYTRDGARI